MKPDDLTAAVASLHATGGVYQYVAALVERDNRPQTKGQTMNDPINPANYRRFPVEVIQLAEYLTFNLGNVVKYTARAGTKPGEPIERDLAKAGWYIDRELARLGFVTETARLRTELEEAQQQLRETHADHEAERARLETHQL